MTESTTADQVGVERRYEVKKINDPDGKHQDCMYFVLDPKHDARAATALRAYAAVAPDALSRDIGEWLRRLGYCSNCSQVRGHRGRCAS